MEDFTNEQVEAAVEFYKQMNVSSDLFLADGKIKDIFSFLNIKPEVDDDGKRKLTPYEILGVLPNICDGVEKPIVFFVKNKIRNIKISKTNNFGELKFSNQKKQSDKDLIEFVLASYRSAIAQNNLAEAERQFETLDLITGGKAKHYIGTFYDYTKFYKQMKKQLLIDLFAHFFLIYLMHKKSLIKKGLVIKNKKFKAYDANKQIANKAEPEMPQIKSIKVDSVPVAEVVDVSKNNIEEIDFDEAIKPKAQEKNNQSEQKIETEVLAKEVPEKVERKSFIRRLKNRLFRKNQKAVNVDYGKEIIKKTDEKNIKIEKEVSYE